MVPAGRWKLADVIERLRCPHLDTGAFMRARRGDVGAAELQVTPASPSPKHFKAIPSLELKVFKPR